jgi:hypothetical protein
MGLDITFYEATERQPPHILRWTGEDGHEHDCREEHDHNRVWLWSLHETPQTFVFTQRGLAEEYCFVSTAKTARWHSSYGGYSIFRAALMDLVRPDLLEAEPHLHQFYPRFWDLSEDEAYGIPFAELFDFADNEGTYGPEAATALLADFEAYSALPLSFGRTFPAWTMDLRVMYAEYLAGLRIVGPTGLVNYH